MTNILCMISLCAMALFSNFVKADFNQDLYTDLRDAECYLKSEHCIEQAVVKLTDLDVLGLCNAKPILNAASKCLMNCQMRTYEWVNDKGFQKDKYLEYIKTSELGHDVTYVDAAQAAADICKDKKDPANDACETAYLILKCLQDEGNKRQKINIGYGIFYVEPFFFEFE